MILLSAQSANELYLKACSAVCRQGSAVRPRGMSTIEVLGAHLCLREPRRRYVDIPPSRVINPAFAVAEAAWILSGSDDPWIFGYNRSLRQFADNGRLQGAYGPRMRCWHGAIDQLDRVRELLLTDPASRQGVIQLFDPARDGSGFRDVPCTLSYRFYVREGHLEMHTTMRSQDLWLGFPYDVFTATVLQELMAGWLGVGLGTYHHHVDSLHIYDHHVELAQRLPLQREPSPSMHRVAVRWDIFQSVVAGIADDTVPAEAPTVWREFAQVLASYRAWTRGDRDRAEALAAGLSGHVGRALQRWYDRLRGGAPPAAGDQT